MNIFTHIHTHTHTHTHTRARAHKFYISKLLFQRIRVCMCVCVCKGESEVGVSHNAYSVLYLIKKFLNDWFFSVCNCHIYFSICSHRDSYFGLAVTKTVMFIGHKDSKK